MRMTTNRASSTWSVPGHAASSSSPNQSSFWVKKRRAGDSFLVAHTFPHRMRLMSGWRDAKPAGWLHIIPRDHFTDLLEHLAGDHHVRENAVVWVFQTYSSDTFHLESQTKRRRKTGGRLGIYLWNKQKREKKIPNHFWSPGAVVRDT